MPSSATHPGTSRPAWARAPLFTLMSLTDAGFLLYWLLSASHALPAAWLFRDHDDPVVSAWNWSFLPLDLLVSASGLGALVLVRRGHPVAATLAIVSLTLTSTSGLMALSFWALRGDFDLSWWGPNALLLLYPLAFARRFHARGGARPLGPVPSASPATARGQSGP